MGGGRSDRRETAPAAPIMAGAMEPGDDEGAQRERELALLEEAAHILAAAPQPDDVYPVRGEGAPSPWRCRCAAPRSYPLTFVDVSR